MMDFENEAMRLLCALMDHGDGRAIASQWLRQFAAKVRALELHNAARAIKGNPVFCDWLERRAKEIEGGE
jgi:hypothetical protein